MLTAMNLLLEEAEDGISLLQRHDARSVVGGVAAYCCVSEELHGVVCKRKLHKALLLHQQERTKSKLALYVYGAFEVSKLLCFCLAEQCQSVMK